MPCCARECIGGGQPGWAVADDKAAGRTIIYVIIQPPGWET